MELALFIAFALLILTFTILWNVKSRRRRERFSMSLHRHPTGKRRKRKEAVESIKTVHSLDSLVGR